MPAVSVILPNFNHADFLKQRIDSILNQTFKDFELLIFDDSSSDASVAIINSYSDTRISHVELAEKNSGSPFGFWEKGIAMAKADLIWIAESDDFSEVSFLEHHVSAFEKDPSLLVSFSASNWVDKDGKVIHVTTHENEVLLKSFKDAVKFDFTKGALIYNASSAVFKKSATKTLNFDQLKKFKYAGDWFFWSSMADEGFISRSISRLNNFRRHENNVSFQAEKQGLHLQEGLEIVGGILAKYNFQFIPKQRILAYWALKVWQNELPQKKKYLASLPSEVYIWYLLAPLLSKIYK